MIGWVPVNAYRPNDDSPVADPQDHQPSQHSKRFKKKKNTTWQKSLVNKMSVESCFKITTWFLNITMLVMVAVSMFLG